MTIVLRSTKGAELSHPEMDGNFTDLDGRTTTNTNAVAILNTKVLTLPKFYNDTNGDPYGIEHPSGTQYPIISQALEVVYNYAIPSSATLTGVDEVLDSFSLPAGSLGPNSFLHIAPMWTYTSSANNKILKVRIGGSTIYNVTRTTSVKEAPLIILANRNSLSSQILTADGSYVSAGTTAPSTFTINFANDVTVEFTGNRASGSDTIKLESCQVLHLMGA